MGNSTMSLSMFNDLCQNVLKLVATRLVSLRLTLTNAIGGWSLISSSLKYQTTLLQRLHLINITPHEFDNLLRNPLIKGLHTLLVDVTSSSPFHYLDGEGVYLTKVCSQVPLLKNCRLPFNVYHKGRYDVDKYSALSIMSLPSLLNTTHLRTLSIGMNTSRFLKRLITCIPFIENLSVGVQDLEMNQKESFDIISLPVAVDAHLLLYLSRLHINCKDCISFHRAIALFSSVFGQLCHLSLKLETGVVISSPLTISGDIIQELCVDRLNPEAIYNLNLNLYVEHDAKEKIIFNSFLTAPFTNRQRSKVFIQELISDDVDHNCHYFTVFTLPCYERKLPTYMFSRALEKSCPMPIHAVDLFPRANELFLHGYRNENCVLELVQTGSTYCLICGPGRYCPDPAGLPVLCAPGSAQVNLGSVQCELCKDGAYADKPGMAVCISCPPGYACSSTTREGLPCPTNRFGGQSKCVDNGESMIG
ncbi:unnamed protein product [Rotaria sordida]|uniref:Tyrosine-protein kinase ephrin type A/B receptor-like domain-containing protein n=3 Tax=Rotaria sordida TaxID=392033 RepID=A0A815ZAE0_9BILA|nr:unnamed protein product [Rotaria sordida]CAF1582268.1 unnamed protein product [Rotaria sordida]